VKNNMSELKEGRMTYRELSVWFGMKPDSLSKNPKTKKKKMEILKRFADYHVEGRCLYIDAIKIPEFSKAYDIIEENFDIEWHKKPKIDTCARVGGIIYAKHPEIQP
jgi:hypothetical protein